MKSLLSSCKSLNPGYPDSDKKILTISPASKTVLQSLIPHKNLELIDPLPPSPDQFPISP